jgi:hypothetical protein
VAQALGHFRYLIIFLAGIQKHKLTNFRRAMAKSAEAAGWAYRIMNSLIYYKLRCAFAGAIERRSRNSMIGGLFIF